MLKGRFGKSVAQIAIPLIECSEEFVQLSDPQSPELAISILYPDFQALAFE
jgi:hypothetical protein